MTDTIAPATAADLPELLTLLAAVNLPPDGVAAYLDGFLIARDPAGRVVGCVGLERHGATGLLRSAAIAHTQQRTGLGSRLVAALLARAQAAGVRTVVLLTTTAGDFFARRFGFAPVARSSYEPQLAGSPEWQLPRCAAATCMHLQLAPPTAPPR